MSVHPEVLAGPFDIYVAPVGTAFPDCADLEAAFDAAWVKLGATGDENYDDNGVTLDLQPTFAKFKGAGSTAATKVWRVEEIFKISHHLVDVTAAQFAKVLNDATVTATAAGAGTAGTDSVSLLQGTDVTLFALLARNPGSPSDSNDAGWVSQYQVPIVYNAGQPSIVGKLGEPQALACEWEALKDASTGFGEYVVQTADAS